jgi:lipoprotein-anchoring transpeptidase ErfK/SrfK
VEPGGDLRGRRLGCAGLPALVVLCALALGAPPALAARVLRFGATGSDVTRLQRRLAALRYLTPTAVNGSFGWSTWHAVVAFQGWERRRRAGEVGRHTWRALRRAEPPRPWSRTTGIEVHLEAQVLLLVGKRSVVRAIHVSTGRRNATPRGHFRVYRRERRSWSKQFHIWMPYAQYFRDGYALHASSAVPARPASHGCVRLPKRDAIDAWRFGRFGMRLWTRRT